MPFIMISYLENSVIEGLWEELFPNCQYSPPQDFSSPRLPWTWDPEPTEGMGEASSAPQFGGPIPWGQAHFRTSL